MAQAIESVKGPVKRRSKSGDRESLNWLPKLKFFANNFFFVVTGLLILKNYTKARARLTVFETGDITPEQVVANAERRREEERQRHVTQHAKKAPSLVPHSKKPTVSLPVRKRHRTEEQPGEAVASAHRKWGRRELSDRPLTDQEAGERTPARQEHLAPSKAAGAATKAASSPSPLAPRPSANFIKVDPAAKFSLVLDIVKSRDLATPGASDAPKVTDEEVAMAKVFARGYQRRREKLQADLDARETKKKGLQHQLEKAAPDAVQVKEQGYQQGRFNTLGYLRKVVLTLADEFQDDNYFETYLHYVDERERATAKGRDPEEVEFIPLSTEHEIARDEATNPWKLRPALRRKRSMRMVESPTNVHFCLSYYLIHLYTFSLFFRSNLHFILSASSG
ncbi:LOW QUALITY PROTEIN: hypothetical protein Cgig2_011355 [Carnegiea gigantea]|uniref:Uncharacterized protein n=1 Tax=Carnegiea gigantea TaxID=171969 RepID=A0A9Q1KTQ2_9CARY|nr:LOW QUALITY PROTEIN: hypothetical protein Cgig2_011355 [Carnegiea gigantea]